MEFLMLSNSSNVLAFGSFAWLMDVVINHYLVKRSKTPRFYLPIRARSYILKASPTTPTGPQKNLNFPQICPNMPRNGPKMTQNAPKWPKYDPKWPKMVQHGPRMTQNDPKWPKNDPKLPKYDARIYALFPQFFFYWKSGSANFFAFRMYGWNPPPGIPWPAAPPWGQARDLPGLKKPKI